MDGEKEQATGEEPAADRSQDQAIGGDQLRAVHLAGEDSDLMALCQQFQISLRVGSRTKDRTEHDRTKV